jgi:8-oxo-dGTP pyrophosphatase MutT (NUDIX family)
VRFAEVLERLATLPVEPPEGPASLMPVLVEGDGVRLRERSGNEATSARPAAVLVLVYPDADGEARVLLTERVDRGGHHSGEVSFPGGRAEPEDADLTATALREAAEEVGLDPAAAGLRVLAVWPPHWIPVSDYAVTPILAVANRLPALVAQPTEVARIVEAPVRLFLPDAELMEVDREVRGWRLRYTAYPVDGLVVWGMTARVLGSLGALLGNVPAA